MNIFLSDQAGSPEPIVERLHVGLTSTRKKWEEVHIAPVPDIEGVGRALERLKQEGFTLGTAKIVDIIVFPKNSHEFRKGIDFKVVFSDGVVIPIKVKATEEAGLRFKKQNRMRPYQIPVVVACRGLYICNKITSQLVSILPSAFVVYRRLRDRVIHTERYYKKSGGRIVRSPALA